MNESINKQFDFKGNITSLIIERYFNHNPEVKMHCLDNLCVLFDFSLPSIIQDTFLKYFLSEFAKYKLNKVCINEGENLSVFVDTIYKDFKAHDYEEYEVHFLNLLHSKLSSFSNSFFNYFIFRFILI